MPKNYDNLSVGVIIQSPEGEYALLTWNNPSHDSAPKGYAVQKAKTRQFDDNSFYLLCKILQLKLEYFGVARRIALVRKKKFC
jgi:hypothetical protein